MYKTSQHLHETRKSQIPIVNEPVRKAEFYISEIHEFGFVQLPQIEHPVIGEINTFGWVENLLMTEPNL